MMKKKIVLFLLVITLVVQPFSLNFTLAKENSSFLEEDCVKCERVEDLNLQKQEVVNDPQIINAIKKSLRNTTKFVESSYKHSDFDWKNVEFLDYGEKKNGVMVPFKKNSDNLDVRLLTAYNKSNQQVSEILIMRSVLTGEKVETSYIDLLNDKEFVNLVIDAKTLELIDVEVSDDTQTGLIQVNEASAAYYPSRVVSCIKKYWNRAPSWMKNFCTGACGSVIFGGNAFGAAMCASCLGASAMSCLISEA